MNADRDGAYQRQVLYYHLVTHGAALVRRHLRGGVILRRAADGLKRMGLEAPGARRFLQRVVVEVAVKVFVYFGIEFNGFRRTLERHRCAGAIARADRG